MIGNKYMKKKWLNSIKRLCDNYMIARRAATIHTIYMHHTEPRYLIIITSVKIKKEKKTTWVKWNDLHECTLAHTLKAGQQKFEINNCFISFA